MTSGSPDRGVTQTLAGPRWWFLDEITAVEDACSLTATGEQVERSLRV